MMDDNVGAFGNDQHSSCLVTSPDSLVSVWSPVLPTTTCRCESSQQASPGIPKLPIPVSTPCYKAITVSSCRPNFRTSYQELVDVHGRIHSYFPSKVVLHLLLLAASRSMVT
jgi:hypothetical protein